MNVGIVGLGLIGGSMAKAIKKDKNIKVYGFDIDETITCKAKLLDAIDDNLTSEIIPECNIIIIALYPGAVVKWMEDNQNLIAPKTIIMDTGGIKQDICPIAEKIAADNGYYFIGAHPMAGLEKVGFEASNPNILNNASMILTPPADTPIDVLNTIKKLCDVMGFGHIEITTPKHHDDMIAYTSQLAHVVSSAYVKADKALCHRGYSANSYRDMTRVATLNEYMWAELFMDNKESLIEEIDNFVQRVSLYSQALKADDKDTLIKLLKDGRIQKERADGKVL